jgi:ATP-dependent Lon protease
MTTSREKTEPRKLPMMPIRDMVIFPYMMTPFVVGRLSSVRALEEALNGDRKIFLATQHDASIDEPKAKEIYQVGSLCNIVQSVKMPDGNIKVLVEGVERAKSIEVNDRDGFFVATVRTGKSDFEMTPAAEQLMQRVTSLFEQYVKLQQSLNYETIIASVRMDEAAKLSDTIAANLQIGIEEKQDLLGIFDPAARLARIADVLDIEIEKLDLDRNIQSRVKRQMERAQKEYYLNEKIKAIQKELGRGEKSEFDELRKKIESAGMPKDVLDKAVQELKKLEAMPPMSAESTVSRNYIDWLLAVPWKKKSKETRSIDFAEKVLNEITTASRRSRTASSNFSRCASSSKIQKVRSSALSDLRASARLHSACPSPRPPAASLFASRSAACATKRKFAVIAAPTSEHCPVRSFSI